MNIVPNKLTLSQLFVNTIEQFVVPTYQRRYSWRFPQVAALFEDINLLKNNDGHLFGMIILHTGGGYNGTFMQPELVDGQQRMTSLTLLLKSLQNAFNKFDRKEKVRDIEKMLTCSGGKNKLLLGELDNLDYEIIMKNGDYSEIKNQNLLNAVYHFDQFLNELNEDELDVFFNKLINVAIIIRLDVTMAQDAYKLFETINNRGLKLSATDIIKNFLLGHASKINDDKTLEDVKKIWSNIITDLDGLSEDDFFRQYMCSILKRKITQSSLITEFKSHYFENVLDTELLGEYEIYINEEEDEDDELLEKNDDIIDEIIKDLNSENEELKEERISITDFLKKVRKSSKIYRLINYAKFEDTRINRRIINLQRILAKPSYIFLMHFLDRDYSINTKIEVLKIIEILMLRRHVCEYRTSENDMIFSHLMEALDEENEEELIIKVKSLIFNHCPIDNEFEDKLPSHDFKGKLVDRARYVLEQLEYEINGNTNETSINASNEVHIEHIIPQTIYTKKSKEIFGDWVAYLGERVKTNHKKYVNRIGNLTLLSAPLNIQASNNPFARKKKSYKSSSLKITNELAKKNDFKFSHLEQRSKEITKKALTIWNINFDDVELE